jgi:hypothetical protein
MHDDRADMANMPAENWGDGGQLEQAIASKAALVTLGIPVPPELTAKIEKIERDNKATFEQLRQEFLQPVRVATGHDVTAQNSIQITVNLKCVLNRCIHYEKEHWMHTSVYDQQSRDGWGALAAGIRILGVNGALAFFFHALFVASPLALNPPRPQSFPLY